MATTTNYGWTTPDDTALVKDGASAIRTLGSSIDTTTKNLNPETTLGDIAYRSSTSNTNTRLGIGSSGQVLTVAAGVPSWATPTASPLTTKGDVFTFSTVAARLAVGTNGQVLTADSSEATGLKFATPAAAATYAIFRDEKTSGTDGGTFTSGAFRTRDINATQFNNITSASIASNQITLPAGTYVVSALAPANRVNQNQMRLQNITDASTTILGVSIWCYDVNLVANLNAIMGAFTIAGTKTFEVQHRCATTRAGDGFGLAAGFGTEVYASITIAKVA